MSSNTMFSSPIHAVEEFTLRDNEIQSFILDNKEYKKLICLSKEKRSKLDLFSGNWIVKNCGEEKKSSAQDSERTQSPAEIEVQCYNILFGRSGIFKLNYSKNTILVPYFHNSIPVSLLLYDESIHKIIFNNTTNIILFFYNFFKACKHAHDHKILHGDLHWNNILINTDGEMRLCDFDHSTIYESLSDGILAKDINSIVTLLEAALKNPSVRVPIDINTKLLEISERLYFGEQSLSSAIAQLDGSLDQLACSNKSACFLRPYIVHIQDTTEPYKSIKDLKEEDLKPKNKENKSFFENPILTIDAFNPLQSDAKELRPIPSLRTSTQPYRSESKSAHQLNSIFSNYDSSEVEIFPPLSAENNQTKTNIIQ